MGWVPSRHTATETHPTQPAGKRGHSRQPVCFYIQFIHSSIQYTETFIYRYIYRISYINLSLFYSNISLDLSYIRYKKSHGRMARTVHECLWGPALTTDCIWRSPRPLGGRAGAVQETLCCGSGGQSGGRSEPSWAEGGGSDPPECGVWRKGDTRSRPILQGRGGEGWADPGASRAESEPAPAPSLQPCVAAALGVGSLSLMAQSWAWVGTTPPQKSQAHPGGGGIKRPDPKPPCYWLGC